MDNFFRNCFLLYPILVLLCFFSFVESSQAAPAAADRNKGGKVPTSITAAGMQYNADAQVVVFTGNVHVKRPDFDLWAAKMTIYLDKSAKNSSVDDNAAGGMQAGEIDRIVAETKVRMKSEDKEGTCDKATYYAKQDKFVMEGSPVLKDKGKNTISGRTVVHYLGTNRSEVQGGVAATFFTPDSSERAPGSGGNSGQRGAQ